MTCIYFFLTSAVHAHHKQQFLNYSFGNTGCRRIEANNEKIQANNPIYIKRAILKGNRHIKGTEQRFFFKP